MKLNNKAGRVLIIGGLASGGLSLFAGDGSGLMDVYLAGAFVILIIVGLVLDFQLKLEQLQHSPGYRIFPPLRYLDIKSFCTKTIVLQHDNCRIHINVLKNGNEVWMCEYTSPPSLAKRADGKEVKEIVLSVGTFSVSRQRKGFRVSWSRKQNWTVVS